MTRLLALGCYMAAAVIFWLLAFSVIAAGPVDYAGGALVATGLLFSAAGWAAPPGP